MQEEYTVGLRQCELFVLSWADFDLQHQYIPRGKRLLMLNEKATAPLNEEHEWHPESPYVFLNAKTGKPLRLHEFYYLHRKLSVQARLPKLGDIQLSDLTEKMAGAFLDERKRCGSNRLENADYPGLSNVTMSRIHRNLQECLDRAVDAGLIAANPAKAFRYATKRKALATTLGEQELDDYLYAAEEHGAPATPTDHRESRT